MKSFKHFLSESRMEDTVKRLEKTGGKVIGTASGRGGKAKIAMNGDNRKNNVVYFLITPDGKFVRGKSKEEVLGKEWKEDRKTGGSDKITKIANDLQALQGDGDAIDMLMAKGYSMGDIDKAARTLGAKSAKAFLGESESLEEAKGLTKAQKDGLMTIKRMGKIINNHGAIKRSVINALHARGLVLMNSRMEWKLTSDGERMATTLSLKEDAVNERELTPAEKEKKEEILKAMKRDGKYDPEDQESASSAHAIATAQAKKSA